MLNIQTADSSVKQAIGLSLLSIGFLCVMFGCLLNLKTTIEVARRSPSISGDPLRNLRESLNADRVFMEHERAFPGSRRRIMVNVLFIGGLVCFFIGTQLLTAP
jgi:hypothetical protein